MSSAPTDGPAPDHRGHEPPRAAAVRDHRRRRARRLHASTPTTGGVRTFVHTEIDRPLRGAWGSGRGSIAEALADVRERGMTIVPQCPFVQAYVDRHPEVADLARRPAPLTPGGDSDDAPGGGVGHRQRRSARDPRRGRAPRPRARRRRRRRSGEGRARRGRARGHRAARRARHRRRRRSRSPTTSTRSSTPRPATRGPTPRSPTSCAASRPGATWCRPRSTRCCTRATGPRSVLDVVERRVRDRRLVGVRLGHRPGLGARHPPRARERRRRRHHRGARPGAVQLRALRPARRRARRHRLRRSDGPTAADAARRLAPDGVGDRRCTCSPTSSSSSSTT